MGRREARGWATTVVVSALFVSVVGLVGSSAQSVEAASSDACLQRIDTLTLRHGAFEGVWGGNLWSQRFDGNEGTLTWDVYSPQGTLLRNVDFQPSVTDPNGDVWGWKQPRFFTMAKTAADGSGLVDLPTDASYVSTFGGGRAWAHHHLDELVILDIDDGSEVGRIQNVDAVQTVIGARTNSALSPVDVEGDRAFVLHKQGSWISVYDLDGNKISDVPKPPGQPNASAFTFEANAAGLFVHSGDSIHHYSPGTLTWTSKVSGVAVPWESVLPDALVRFVDFGDGIGGLLAEGSQYRPFYFVGSGQPVRTSSTALDVELQGLWRTGNSMHVSIGDGDATVYVFDKHMTQPGVTVANSVGGIKFDYNMVSTNAQRSVINSWDPWGAGTTLDVITESGDHAGRVTGLTSLGQSYVSGSDLFYVHEEFLTPTIYVYDLSGCGWNGTFSDDDSSVFESDIEWMAAEGITKGCNPPANDRFCPDSDVTRGQMAAFLRRAFDLPSSSTDFFTDDNDSVFEADINALAASGITKGCNPPASDRFCPDGRVTREQMAAFMKRAFDYPPSATDFFVDDDESIFEADINSIAEVGVTRGCNPSEGNTRYCPRGYVTRGQMAAFLHRAMG